MRFSHLTFMRRVDLVFFCRWFVSVFAEGFCILSDQIEFFIFSVAGMFLFSIALKAWVIVIICWLNHCFLTSVSHLVCYTCCLKLGFHNDLSFTPRESRPFPRPLFWGWQNGLIQFRGYEHEEAWQYRVQHACKVTSLSPDWLFCWIYRSSKCVPSAVARMERHLNI